MHHSMQNNLLNGIGPDTVLYRFIKRKRCCELFSKKHLVLVRPSIWEDPFEDFLSKTTFVVDGERGGFNLTKGFVGQCWTTKPECDGLWRNYCGLKNGVRISTTAGKLIDAVWDHADKYAHLRTFVGAVQYLSDDDIKRSLTGCANYGHELTSPDGKGVAATLLVKRNEFAYENEVRVLATESDINRQTKITKIDPVSFIDTILFSPSMPQDRVDRLRIYLESCGVASKAISRSTLYDPWTLHLQ